MESVSWAEEKYVFEGFNLGTIIIQLAIFVFRKTDAYLLQGKGKARIIGRPQPWLTRTPDGVILACSAFNVLLCLVDS